jgi:hypothetical protein
MLLSLGSNIPGSQVGVSISTYSSLKNRLSTRKPSSRESLLVTNSVRIPLMHKVEEEIASYLMHQVESTFAFLSYLSQLKSDSRRLSRKFLTPRSSCFKDLPQPEHMQNT